MRKMLRCLAILAALALTSCSWLMTNSIPKRPYLRSGLARQEVTSVLGDPRREIRLSPGVPASTLPHVDDKDRSKTATLRDEYRVSGLVQLPGDRYAFEDNIYPAFFIVTAGLIEVLAFPLETVDLLQLGLHRHHLYIWYETSGKLVAYDRK